LLKRAPLAATETSGAVGRIRVAGVRLIKETLANIAAIVALTLMSGTVKADQATKTTAQMAIAQFDECAESLFKDEFDPAEVDYELNLISRPYRVR
jgi:hypothetical protein